MEQNLGLYLEPEQDQQPDQERDLDQEPEQERDLDQ